ncbi:hypothetical protein ISN76_18775 [Dyella halodurans]|uniref:Uncharacterized protein n=1 Tax=Dyella halodurans TaxID=1920171 RepID=A0ABV9C8M2_9GAMM|nr:hypothetical protein [Dyella halodurans]
MQMSKAFWMGPAALALLFCSQAASADPAANAAGHLFMQVCRADNLAHPERIRAWAAEHHLPEVSNPKGRAVFVGDGPNGIAWHIHDDNTELVLAIRSKTGGCAVYAEPLDPAALGQIYSMLIAGYAKEFSVTTPLPDKAQPGPYGTATGKVRLVDGPDSKSQLLLTLITHEKPGGPYQGALQITLTHRSS